MAGFVKIILEASFTAGLAALAVMLIRIAMKKAPKRWAYALWAVVFFRCLCPFSIESGLSVFNAVNAIPERAVETETVEALPEAAENSEIENILPVQTDLNTYGYQTAAPVDTVYAPPVAVRTEKIPEKKPVNKYAVMFGVWAFGAAAMALYGVISYVLLMRKLRTAVKTEAGVYESDLISTAFSAGFFPPKIYVPCGLFEEERKLIIAHERVHIKRLDYIIKPVAFLGLAVHWFNPLIWLAFALMTKDMELSCDEAVLKIFGVGEKKAYSEALLRVSMKRSGLADSYKFMPLAFAETGIKGRVKNVLKYKKPTVIVTVLAAAVVVSACAVLGTNAKEDNAVNSELLEAEEKVYTPIPEGETEYTLADGAKVCIANAPDKNTSLDSTDERVYGIQYTSDSNGGDKSRSVWLGMRAKNNELNRQICLDFGNKKITGFSVEDIYATDLQFTAVIKVTLADGEEITVISPNEPNEKIRVLNGDKENEYLLYMTADYDRENVDEYAIDFYGFDNITPQINTAFSQTVEVAPEYTLVSDGSLRLTLETGETAYVACGFQNISFDTDDSTYSVKGFKDRGASICCLSTHADGSSSADFSDVLDFGEHPITFVTVENMYTEKSGTGVKLYTEIKAASPTGDGLMNSMAINDDDFEIAVAKLINDEYRFTIVKEYDTDGVVIDGFAVIIGGLEDVPVYVNTKLLTDNFVNRESRGNIQKVYKNGFVFIELYDSGYFTVTNFISSLFIPSIEKAYRYEDDSLILEFNDGSELYFDVAYDENVQDNKLIYNGSLSHVTDELSGYLFSFDDGEVFLPDEEWLEIAKAGVRQTVYRSAVDCTNVEMAYSRDFRTIYLFKNGDFDVHDSSLENDPNEGIDGSYQIDGEILTLNFTDGAALCFDMISSAMDVIDPELVKEFDMCRYKLVYNKEKSGISEGQTGDIPEFYHGEVFDYDEGFIELKKKAKENGEKYRREQEAKEEEIRRKLEEAQKRAEEQLKSSYPALQYPVDGGISKGYSVGDNFHHAIDFAVSKGTEVYAAADGTVTETGTGFNGGYGNSVTISHVGTMETVYAHMDEVLVKEGDEVNAGDVIGYSGSTGDAVGAELHFEVRIDGQFVDPMEYIPPVLSYPTTGGIYQKYGENGLKGINFDAPTGKPVYASADGTVAEIGSGWNGGYGNSVTINHRGNMETVYAHMKEILVKEGDEVKKGDLIGYSGTTGDTAYQVLFFGVRINGSYVDPMDYLGLRHFDGDKFVE